MVACIGGNSGSFQPALGLFAARLEGLPDTFEYGRDQAMFLPLAEGFCMDDNLMGAVDRCNAGVALDYAVAGFVM